jgi:proteasome assembly chaperone (PAC2) family protein
MDELVQIWEKPVADEIYLIAGWHQWADAGNVSSGLPQYLIDQMDARQVGEIKPEGFYLFQIPGTHHFLRPEVSLVEGYRQALSAKKNEFFYTGNDKVGLLIFLGDEPHMNADRYAEAFFDVVEDLGVRRVGAIGGVYGAMPYDRDREISCTYSSPAMKAELNDYAVKFSNYEGGVTISTYLVDTAEKRGIEFFTFYAFVPAYDFSQVSGVVPGMRIENDFKAWYDLMRRFNHMFHLGIDLTDLEKQQNELLLSMEAKITELEEKVPQLKIREYIDNLTSDFVELPFSPLDDVWERELGDILDDLDE